MYYLWLFEITICYLLGLIRVVDPVVWVGSESGLNIKIQNPIKFELFFQNLLTKEW